MSTSATQGGHNKLSTVAYIYSSFHIYNNKLQCSSSQPTFDIATNHAVGHTQQCHSQGDKLTTKCSKWWIDVQRVPVSRQPIQCRLENVNNHESINELFNPKQFARHHKLQEHQSTSHGKRNVFSARSFHQCFDIVRGKRNYWGAHPLVGLWARSISAP